MGQWWGLILLDLPESPALLKDKAGLSFNEMKHGMLEGNLPSHSLHIEASLYTMWF